MPNDLSARADAALYDRAVATLVASWAHFATGSPGAEVVAAPGVAIAVFVHAPDREIFNNAVLARGADADVALDAVERTYREAGVERYAVWVHESAAALAGRVVARGYAPDESTRVMAMRLDELADVADGLDLAPAGFADFLRINGLPAGLFPELGAGAHIHTARVDGRPAATAMAFDHAGDCGIYNVATLPCARRRGLATALTAHALRQARARGCTTASLQSTAMAERVYAAVGFRDLGRFVEHVPAG